MKTLKKLAKATAALVVIPMCIAIIIPTHLLNKILDKAGCKAN